MDALKELKEALLSVTQAFKAKYFEEAKEVKLKDVKATDGSLLSYDGETPMAGMPVFILDEAGQRLPAPSADYVLEDGSTLKIQDGVIMEIVAGEVVEEASSDTAKVDQAAEVKAPAPPNPKAIVESTVKEYRFQEQIDEIKKLIEDKTELEAKFKSVNDTVTRQDEMIKEIFAMVEKIASMPSGESKVEKKDGFQKKRESSSSLEDKVAELQKLMK